MKYGPPPRKEDLLKRVLEFSLCDEVRSQDTVFVVGGATSSKLGRDLTWGFVKDKWDFFSQRYQSGALQARLVKFATEGFARWVL
jgi:puromycin-sensitive aminopeptidase